MLGDVISREFGPLWNDAVTAATPVIESAFKSAGQKAADAMIAGFKASPSWVKLLTAAFLINKTRSAFTSFGSQACGPFANKFNPCVGNKFKASAGKGGAMALAFGAGGTMLGVVAGAALAAAIIDYFADDKLGERGRDVTPEGTRKTHVVQPGDPTAQDIVNRRTAGSRAPSTGGRFGGRATPLAPLPSARPRAAPHPIGFGPDVIVPVTVVADGKPIAKATARASRKAKATR
jgi:hypothetical protein